MQSESELEAAVEAEHAEAQRAHFERRVSTARHQLNVPPLYFGRTLDDFQLHGEPEDRRKQSRVLQLARRYIGVWPDDIPAIVVLQGGPGTGKGFVLWAIAQAIAGTHGDKARVVKLPDVIRDLRDAWHGAGNSSELARIAAYRAPMFLGIDEVSRHAFYGQPQQHLYDLIDHREEQLRPTILTTNETSAGLAELLGPALLSRCMGWGSIWDFGVADYRAHRGREQRAKT